MNTLSQSHSLDGMPEMEEFTYEDRGFTFSGKKTKWEGEYKTKYSVSVHQNERFIGRFTFYTSEKFIREIIMSGLYIEPEYRCRGIAKLFMDELSLIASASGREFIHAVPQRKPVVCRLLSKSGFYPVSKSHMESDIVYVGRGENPSTPYVYFPSQAKKREFANSKICKSQPYTVAINVNEVHDAVECVMNADYIRI